MKILSRFLNGNFELLEPYEGKLSCTVLRGESGSNAADLLDNLSVTANFLRNRNGEIKNGVIEFIHRKLSERRISFSSLKTNRDVSCEFHNVIYICDGNKKHRVK